LQHDSVIIIEEKTYIWGKCGWCSISWPT